MAAGKTHNKANNIVLLSIISSVVWYNYTINLEPYSLYIVLGSIIAYYIDPDMLDQHQVTTYGEYRIKRQFGWLIFILVYTYLWPLAKILPHRGILSHYPPVNTCVRLLYLSIPIIILIWYFSITHNRRSANRYGSFIFRFSSIF
jgi:uncharacterized metal-binding protein